MKENEKPFKEQKSMKKIKNKALKRPIYRLFILSFSKKVHGLQFLRKNMRNFLNTFVKSKEGRKNIFMVNFVDRLINAINLANITYNIAGYIRRIPRICY